MSWETKEVLVTVKAYPEKSTKYGETVCVAGVTREGEFIRLYPVHFDCFRGNRPIRKYSWIKVECQKNNEEKLGRKESYKVRTGSAITVIDRELTKPPIDWQKRNEILAPLISDSIEDLRDRAKRDRTSLGLVKVKSLEEFYTKEELDEIELEESLFLQSTVTGATKTLLMKIPHVFRYKFTCSDNCPGHDMSVEDWEVFESFRSWLKYYKGDYAVLWQKLKQKYETMMRETDLHFFMGTESQYGRWLIIGLYYPPKQDVKPGESLDDYLLKI